MVGESKSPGISPYELKQLFENVLKGSDGKTLTDLYNQLASILGQLDITLSQLRDALRGTNNRTLTDLYNKATDIYNKAYDSVNDLLKLSIERDNVGLATEATLSSIDSKIANQHVLSDSASIAATDNTAGLELVLNKPDKFHINVYYSVGGAAEIYVEVSLDKTTWRQLDKITTAGAKTDIEQYPWVLYPYVKVRTPTTGIDVEFEIVAL